MSEHTKITTHASSPLITYQATNKAVANPSYITNKDWKFYVNHVLTNSRVGSGGIALQLSHMFDLNATDLTLTGLHRIDQQLLNKHSYFLPLALIHCYYAYFHDFLENDTEYHAKLTSDEGNVSNLAKSVLMDIDPIYMTKSINSAMLGASTPFQFAELFRQSMDASKIAVHQLTPDKLVNNDEQKENVLPCFKYNFFQDCERKETNEHIHRCLAPDCNERHPIFSNQCRSKLVEQKTRNRLYAANKARNAMSQNNRNSQYSYNSQQRRFANNQNYRRYNNNNNGWNRYNSWNQGPNNWNNNNNNNWNQYSNNNGNNGNPYNNDWANNNNSNCSNNNNNSNKNESDGGHTIIRVVINTNDYKKKKGNG